MAGVDPSTGELVRLFHPRRDSWLEHFEWDGSELRGRTQVGRVTMQVLAMNARDFRAMRAALMEDWAYDWA